MRIKQNVCSKLWTDTNIDFRRQEIRHCCKSVGHKMYKIYYAQRYRVKKFDGLSQRYIRLRNRVEIREKYKCEKKIKPTIRYNVVKD